jgi:hypothetical protein
MKTWFGHSRTRVVIAILSAAALGRGIDARAAARPAGAFAEYQKLLDDYLSVTSAKGAPLETRFDYARMRDLSHGDDRGLARGVADRLDRAQDQLFPAGPAPREPRARLAWAIDAYNFLVIRKVADHAGAWRAAAPPTSVQQLGGPHGDFFSSPATSIEDRPYSLNDFEKSFVFPGRGTAKPGPYALDPRAHFALVCGARGCPPLEPRAFLSESLEAQLDHATRESLASPRHLKWDPRSRRLEASEIFEWYAADFGGARGALAFIRKYGPAEVRSAIDRGEVTSISGFIPWDWELNQTPR